MRFANIVSRFLLFPLGFALVTAAFLFQEGTTLSANQIVSTPTLDRLAEPTLSVAPSQADYGAQVYWLYCLPCHGDKGQGLTNEFRATYPPEDQNCWKSHCHGNVTYENGFKLPQQVPQLIGEGALAKFPSAANLYGFISSAMPFQKPGSLTDEQYYQIVSFLLRQNGLLGSQTEVNSSNLAAIIVSRATPISTPQQAEAVKRDEDFGWVIIIGVLSFFMALIFILKKSENTTTI